MHVRACASVRAILHELPRALFAFVRGLHEYLYHLTPGTRLYLEIKHGRLNLQAEAALIAARPSRPRGAPTSGLLGGARWGPGPGFQW